MKAILLIIISGFKRRKILNGLIILLVAVSVCILNLALGLCNGFETRLLDKILSFTPHISVISKNIPKPDPAHYKQMLKIIQGQALIINPDNQISLGVVLKSTKVSDVPKLINNVNIIEGKYPSVNEMLVGNKLADYL